MKASEIVGWTVMLCLLTFLMSLFFITVARANEQASPVFLQKLVTAQGSLASKSASDPPVDARELAEAILAVPKVTGEWAALMLTVAGHETALSARIARGECRPRECDHGAAWGLYQIHRSSLNRQAWGSPDIGVQTSEAARELRRAFYACQKGPLRSDWARRTISAYAGRGCEAMWPGLEARLATFERLRRRL